MKTYLGIYPRQLFILADKATSINAVIQDSLNCLDDLADGGVSVVMHCKAVLNLHLINKTLINLFDL